MLLSWFEAVEINETLSMASYVGPPKDLVPVILSDLIWHNWQHCVIIGHTSLFVEWSPQ